MTIIYILTKCSQGLKLACRLHLCVEVIILSLLHICKIRKQEKSSINIS